MDSGFYVPIVVAVIAAAASLLAAWASAKSAARAQRSSERVNGVNQRIAALDRDAEELREAYKRVAIAWSTARGSAGAVALAAELEVLRACRASDDRLDAAASEMADFVNRGVQTGDSMGFSGMVEGLRAAYRHCQSVIAMDREDFFTRDLNELDGWAVRILGSFGR